MKAYVETLEAKAMYVTVQKTIMTTIVQDVSNLKIQWLDLKEN